jgi:hypothetical protein
MLHLRGHSPCLHYTGHTARQLQNALRAADGLVARVPGVEQRLRARLSTARFLGERTELEPAREQSDHLREPAFGPTLIQRPPLDDAVPFEQPEALGQERR